jgi:hypothetical protein
MTKSFHDVLDGLRDREGLSDRDLRELALLEMTIDAAAESVRSATVPDFSAAVMRDISAMPLRPVPSVWAPVFFQSLLDWFWAPRLLALRVRPAFALTGLCAAASLALLAAPSVDGSTSDGATTGAAEQPVPSVYVQFRLDARGASRVALAGSFTDWTAEYEMRETTPGTWSILLPLPPGVHDYAFLVDGSEWVADPHALQIEDGFGGANSRIALPSLATDPVQL